MEERMATIDEQPMPYVETLTDRTHGRRIVSHIHHDHLHKVRMARQMMEWTVGFITPNRGVDYVAV